MYAGKFVLAQLIEHAPRHTFRRLVTRYQGDFNVRSFSRLDKVLCMTVAPETASALVFLRTAIAGAPHRRYP